MKMCRKPAHSARYLQYTSNHTKTAKGSVARALFGRVQHVTEDEEKRKEERGTEEELDLNDFPTKSNRTGEEEGKESKTIQKGN